MRLRGILTAAALAVPQAALAELSVEQAWAVWTTQFEALGLEWEADAEREGAALVVGPIALTLGYPDAGVEMHLQLPGPRFVPRGGGVIVQLPDSAAMPFRVITRGSGAEGNTASGAFEMRMKDTTVRMRESDAGVVARWTGETYEIDLTAFELLGQPFPARYRYLQSGFDIVQTSEIGGGWLEFARSGTAGQVIIDYRIGDNSTAEGIQGSFEREDVDTETEVRLPQSGPVLKQLAAQTQAGMAFRHEAFSPTGRDWDKEWTDGALVAQSETSWRDIRGAITLSGKGVRVTSGSEAAAMQMTDVELGLSFDLEATRVLLDLAMPLLRAPEEQPFTFRFDLDRLTMSEESWAQFFDVDTLPRETADVSVDLSGTMILMETLLDFAAMANLSGDNLPFTVETLGIDALRLRLADAEATGTGTLRFDHTDYDTLDGFPATTGEVGFDLTGAHGFLDRMTEAGILPGDAAMSARMMMGMFTKRVEDAEDLLRSVVAFGADGKIMVNGQRLH